MSAAAVAVLVLFVLGCIGQVAINLAPLRIAGILAREERRRKRG